MPTSGHENAPPNATVISKYSKIVGIFCTFGTHPPKSTTVITELERDFIKGKSLDKQVAKEVTETA